ncbi:MAG: thioesterase family protein [Bacteroidota bacterium]
MNRIKIQLPEHLTFITTVPIRITDINYGNHVGNQVFFELIQEARVRFLQQFDYGELNFEGVGLIMADAAIEFHSEVLYGDNIEIAVGISDIANSSFNIFYLLTVLRNEKRIRAAKAKTGIVCFNYAEKKVVAIPALAKEKLSSALTVSTNKSLD